MENYQLGKPLRVRRHHWWIFILVFVVLSGLSAGGWFAAKHYLRPDTTINQSHAVVTKVTGSQLANKRFSERTFTIELPHDWAFVGQQSKPYLKYSWHNTAKADNPGSRMLDVYVDTLPANLGVNRVLPVQAAGDRLVPTTVSDNCAEFTGDKVPGSATTPAKWQNVNFLCDLANYVRNLTGTSSPQGVNTVTLTGKNTGQHRFFFTYTDNSSDPDLTVFSSALRTFRAK